MSLLNWVLWQKEKVNVREHILTLWICFISTSLREQRKSKLWFNSFESTTTHTQIRNKNKLQSNTAEVISKNKYYFWKAGTSQKSANTWTAKSKKKNVQIDYYWLAYVIKWVEMHLSMYLRHSYYVGCVRWQVIFALPTNFLECRDRRNRKVWVS